MSWVTRRVGIAAPSLSSGKEAKAFVRKAGVAILGFAPAGSEAEESVTEVRALCVWPTLLALAHCLSRDILTTHAHCPPSECS